LRVRASNRPSGRHHDRRVEAESVWSVGALEQRCVDVDPGLGGNPRREAVGWPAGQLLRLDPARRRAGAVNGEVAAERELGQADELRALAGGEPDPVLERRGVLARVGMPALL
jgi:hypothetical protein